MPGAILHSKSLTQADGTNAGIVRPSDWNSGHILGLSITGNTQGQSTAAGSNILMAGGPGVDLRISQGVGGGSNEATLSIEQHYSTKDEAVIYPKHQFFQQSSISLGQNSLYIYPCRLDQYVTAAGMRMPVLITNSSSGAASVQKGLTFQFGVYTMDSADSTKLNLLYSTTHTIAASHNSNASWMLSMITAIGNSTSYNTQTASSAGINLSSSMHGPRELLFPFSTLLSVGEYWWAVRASSSSVGAGGNVLNISNVIAAPYQTYNRLGVVTNATNSGFHKQIGMGTYSVTTGGMPATIGITQINQAGTAPVLFLANQTV